LYISDQELHFQHSHSLQKLLVPNGLSEWWMNTKIEFGTNQSLTSKLKILLGDAKGYIGQLIELAPTVCLSPLQEWKSKELKLNLLHTIHYKVSPEMSIHETMDQSKILFDEATQQLNIRIHEELASEWYLTLDALVHFY
jgi:hypothetical protein